MLSCQRPGLSVKPYLLVNFFVGESERQAVYDMGQHCPGKRMSGDRNSPSTRGRLHISGRSNTLQFRHLV